jgi:hypothetical protein
VHVHLHEHACACEWACACACACMHIKAPSYMSAFCGALSRKTPVNPPPAALAPNPPPKAPPAHRRLATSARSTLSPLSIVRSMACRTALPASHRKQEGPSSATGKIFVARAHRACWQANASAAADAAAGRRTPERHRPAPQGLKQVMSASKVSVFY